MQRTPELPLISDYPAHFAALQPEREALILGDERLSYAAFAERIERCARALLACGVAKGDRVATLSTPRPVYLVVYLAAARIGAIWCGLNPRAKIDELSFVVGDAAPRLLLSISAFEGRDFRPDLERLMADHPCLERLVMLDDGAPGLGESFEDFLATGDGVADRDLDSARRAVSPDDAALVVYTSGSTGRPKGALLSHAGIVHTARVQCEHWWAEPFRIMNNMPINHIGGAVQISCHAIVAGGTNVMMERFAPSEMPAVIERERVTIMHLVATMYRILLDREEARRHDLSSLQTLVWSGAPAPRDLIGELRRLTPRLFTSYGQTEVGGEVTFTPDGASDEVLAETAGRPEQGYDIRIGDEHGQPVPAGEAGEIQVRAKTVMLGYFHRPEDTAAAFTPDGYLCTSDLAEERPDGNYRIVGRLREMFKSGGYNVYPREIELAIEGHAGVAMAAVVGVPDALYGEVGHAYVLREADAEVSAAALDAHCRDRLANYKVPKLFAVRDSLPMLPIGKIDKPALKAEALADSGAGADGE